MNKTQKGTWFCLVIGLLSFALSIQLGVEMSVLKRLPEGFGRFWGLLAFWLVTGIAIIFVRKKQSSGEHDSDERDELIKKRAVQISFVSVWLLLATATLIAALILGEAGSIPVYLLILIILAIFIIVLLIYSVAVLVQYGWRCKGENHE
jgi:Na+/H+ antiporter NhaC